MNSGQSYYDVAVIGGGLAGLATAIQMVRSGFSTVVFEKETYPFHKVCGEYISLGSWEFLLSLGLPLEQWHLPVMDTLELSSPGGQLLRQKLPLGGFGVSRHLLDDAMMRLAAENGATVYENTKVHDVEFTGEGFIVKAGPLPIHARVCCGAFGKRSNLDVKWKRPFAKQKQSALNNFIGVKYHVRSDHPQNTIALHNFKHGYCGVAAIEDNRTNLCYLTTAQSLRDHGNDLQAMERNVLCRNPFLKKIFTGVEFLYDRPLTISQISFERKEQVVDHVLLTGDAAGMITPLCGNGMSMALEGSRIAAGSIIPFLQNTVSRKAMEMSYTKEWEHSFSSRLQAGRIIQGLFGHEWITNVAVRVLKPFPSIADKIIRRTYR